jgi:hypothetical protein
MNTDVPDSRTAVFMDRIKSGMTGKVEGKGGAYPV